LKYVATHSEHTHVSRTSMVAPVVIGVRRTCDPNDAPAPAPGAIREAACTDYAQSRRLPLSSVARNSCSAAIGSIATALTENTGLTPAGKAHDGAPARVRADHRSIVQRSGMPLDSGALVAAEDPA
jgi:hypothetical protein